MRKYITIWIRLGLAEAFLWIAALLYLALLHIVITPGISFCLLDNIGVGFCPGCGIGSSIHHTIHMQFSEALASHPLGPLALVVIISRIFVLFKQSLAYFKLLNKKQLKGSRI